MEREIVIKGAREHTLQNVSLRIPRDKLVVITGLSGSGKSSLAFDTIYAEGQRRYVESLSSYARMFLGRMSKPDVDSIDGLSPAVSIDQKTTSTNPRSTVATTTEIYDYLRLLYARVGVAHCPECGKVITQQTADQVTDSILNAAAETSNGRDGAAGDSASGTGAEVDGALRACDTGTASGQGAGISGAPRALIMAPLVQGKKGEFTKLFADLSREGFVRFRVDGTIIKYDGTPLTLNKKVKHFIEVIIDRVVLRESSRSRITSAVEQASILADGSVLVSFVDEATQANAQSNASAPAYVATSDAATVTADAATSPDTTNTPAQHRSSGAKGARTSGEFMYSLRNACPEHGYSVPDLQPRDFSFNAPYGACPSCLGLGSCEEVDPHLVVPDTSLSIAQGAVAPFKTGNYYPQVLEAVVQHMGGNADTPWCDLPEKTRHVLLYGTREKVRVHYIKIDGRKTFWDIEWHGIVAAVRDKLKEASSDRQRDKFMRYIATVPCEACKGQRLRPEMLAVTVGEKSIYECCHMSARDSLAFFESLHFSGSKALIAEPIVKEIRARLQFLVNVGLDYLSLERSCSTLSGGEAQRIRLATQIGAGLMGVLYILDEPSIGLHQRDNVRLIRTLQKLRDLGNTVLVVEHDEDTIRVADWVIDMGPGAGEHGGHVVAQGTPADIIANKKSLTGAYLSGRKSIAVPRKRRHPRRGTLTLYGASENNLQNLTVSIPLGTFTCVTGVSGSGKSSLISDTLAPLLCNKLNGARMKEGAYKRVTGLEHLNKVIIVDQSPIGRTPRSNPATYVGLWDHVRDLYASTPEAKLKGFRPGRFSFNTEGGRCEVCKGDGQLKIEMHFLPDIYVACEECDGARYNCETLSVLYKGKSIADVLDMTVDEALHFFENISCIRTKLQSLHDVGLGYIRLGQSSTTLSGGEAQRVKLSSELNKRATGKTMYILDEPTTGLHFEDVDQLLSVLQRLVDAGNTVLVIEHNLDVIKCADHIIDLGPEGGSGGGRIVACGTPEDVCACKESYTGQFLTPLLARG